MKRSSWANDWWQQAEHDRQAAESLNANGFWDTCALMCEQAAEKAVKALWIDVKQGHPPKTHRFDLMLVDLGAGTDEVNAAYSMVGDYFGSRYPGAVAGVPFSQYGHSEAEDRLAECKSIMSWVESHWED